MRVSEGKLVCVKNLNDGCRQLTLGKVYDRMPNCGMYYSNIIKFNCGHYHTINNAEYFIPLSEYREEKLKNILT